MIIPDTSNKTCFYMASMSARKGGMHLEFCAAARAALPVTRP